jgi:hypothetical protein
MISGTPTPDRPMAVATADRRATASRPAARTASLAAAAAPAATRRVTPMPTVKVMN